MVSAIYPGRTFKILTGTGVVLTLLLAGAVYRAIGAGCPDGLWESNPACLFLPTHTDLAVHLLSYAFVGMTLLGTSSWLLLGCRQWSKMRALTRNLARLHVSGSELELLTCRLGLKDKVHLLDCEAPLCFCAGFISPRIYLSRGILEKLAPEQLEALLLHEKYHLRNYDPVKVLLGRLVVAALFFVPVVPDILKRYLIEKEIAADQSAIHYQGHYRGIAGALKKLVQEHSTTPAVGLTVSATEALEYRIGYLTGHVPQHVYPIPLRRVFTSFLIIAVILVTIVVPLPSSHPLAGHIVSSTFIYSGQGVIF